MKKRRPSEGTPSESRPKRPSDRYRLFRSEADPPAGPRFGPLASPQRGPSSASLFPPAAPCRQAHLESSPFSEQATPPSGGPARPQGHHNNTRNPEKSKRNYSFFSPTPAGRPPKAVFAAPGDVTASRLPRLLHPLPTPTSGWPAGAGPASARCLATQKQRG